MEAGRGGGGGSDTGGGGALSPPVVYSNGGGTNPAEVLISIGNPYTQNNVLLNNTQPYPLRYSNTSLAPAVNTGPLGNSNTSLDIASVSLNNNLYSLSSIDSIHRPPSVTSINGSITSNGVIANGAPRGNGTISPGSRSGGTISPNGRNSGTTSPNGRNSGTTSPNGRSPGTTSPSSLADTHTSDRRAERLAQGGLGVTIVAFALTLVAVCTSQWARFAGSQGGFLGPFLICKDGYRGYSECSSHSRMQPAGAAILAGVCAVLSCLLALVSAALSGAVVAMHRSETRVCMKFKHTTVVRMVVTAAAGFLSFIAVVSFIVEVYLMRGVVVGGLSSLTPTWGFYMEMLGMILLWVAGGLSSAEWQKSRKLGGDPTIRNKDPQGLQAHTISNPHFKDDHPPPVRIANTKDAKAPVVKKPKTVAMTPMDVHRNTNGVAMTSVSGQPYMMTTQNGHLANGKPKRAEITTKSTKPATAKFSTTSLSKNKDVVTKSSKSPRYSRKPQSNNNGNTIVAFDPSRTPLRSSLRKPKQQQQLQGSTTPSMDESVDTGDGSAEGGIPNPAFAQSSPPMPKKKVRIHTQSTAV